MLSERTLRGNETVKLFEIDGVPVMVPILKMNRAAEWASRARVFDAHQFAMVRISERMERMTTIYGNAKRKFETLALDQAADPDELIRLSEACESFMNTVEEAKDQILRLQEKRQVVMAECMASYDPDSLSGYALQDATAAQITSAFYLLRKLNDPFRLTASLAGEAVNGLKSAESPTSQNGSVDKPEPSQLPSQLPETSGEPEPQQPIPQMTNS